MPAVRAGSAALLGAIALAAIAGCGAHDRAPGVSAGGEEEPGDGGAAPDGPLFDVGSSDGPPPADASGLCGNEILPALADPANLYFVIDRSGSMGDAIGGKSKYQALRSALAHLIESLGAAVNVGAAAFPGPGASYGDSCGTGVEILSTRPGDPLSGGTTQGPTATAFLKATSPAPSGGTPTAATVKALTPTLVGLPGRTFVVLATDGAPNCNPQASCDRTACIPNIEGSTGCTSTNNCCDPADPSYGPSLCLQGEETADAIAGLLAAGVRTYVIGLPEAAGQVGVPAYASLLDDMAVAGGTARPTSPRYYAIGALSELDQVLAAIGAHVVLTCDFKLAEAPPDPNDVNVYLDSTEVAYDAEDGWVWTGERSLALRGAACDELQAGHVQQVQVVAGCPTKQPN